MIGVMEDRMGLSCNSFDVEEEININETGKCNQDSAKGDELIESAKAEMTGVKEENARLKTMLQKIEKDYKTLQMKFNDIFFANINGRNPIPNTINGGSTDDQAEHELVSLRLGRSPSPTHESIKEDSHHVISSTISRKNIITSENDELKLGLDCKLDQGLKAVEFCKDSNNTATDNCSFTGKKEDEAGEKWPPSKVLKTQRSSGEDEISPTVKKARVSVRARCDTPTMNDGCQWRKYGQKVAKNNPCPRAYYRCTVSPSCPVRKQVQRCAEDMSILITTYEGNHDHPLPVTATAMASTTSAAATMLLSGSSTSSSTTAVSVLTNLYGQSFHLTDNSRTQPFYMPNSSSSSFPTITLDLTTNPSTRSSGLNSSGFRMTPRVSTSLNFSSIESNMIPSVWGSGGFSYGTSLPYNDFGCLQPGKLPQEQKYQTYSEKLNQPSSQQALTETLTKVITSDPSFRSVIAAAISSMAANGGAVKGNSTDKGENFGQDLKWAEHKQATDSMPLTSNGKGDASNYLNKSASLNS